MAQDGTAAHVTRAEAGIVGRSRQGRRTRTACRLEAGAEQDGDIVLAMRLDIVGEFAHQAEEGLPRLFAGGDLQSIAGHGLLRESFQRIDRVRHRREGGKGRGIAGVTGHEYDHVAAEHDESIIAQSDKPEKDSGGE